MFVHLCPEKLLPCVLWLHGHVCLTNMTSIRLSDNKLISNSELQFQQAQVRTFSTLFIPL
jgi:hypothetical protein